MVQRGVARFQGEFGAPTPAPPGVPEEGLRRDRAELRSKIDLIGDHSGAEEIARSGDAMFEGTVQALVELSFVGAVDSPVGIEIGTETIGRGELMAAKRSSKQRGV